MAAQAALMESAPRKVSSSKPVGVGSSAPPLFFLHIRKTAGCTVRNLLTNRFSVDGCLLDVHHVANQTVDPSRFGFVTGHVPFCHTRRFKRRPIVIVFLRSPLERAQSAFYFFRSHDEAYMQWLGATLPAEEFAARNAFANAPAASLLEFLEREPELARGLLGDAQTQCLLDGAAGGQSYLAVQKLSEAEMLQQAKRNLESCALIGLTERMEDSMALIAHRLGWPAFGPIPRDNPTRSRPPADALDPRAREILTDWTRLDAELYRFAAQLFERRWQQMQRERAHPQAAATEPFGGLPSSAAFTFDQPIHGQGWHQRERDAAGWFCWTGASPEATIDLRLRGPDRRRLRCRVAHVLRPAVLESLRLCINGEPVAVETCADGTGFVLEAAASARLLAAQPGHLRLAFAAQTARPCDLDPASGDARPLGIALRSIALVEEPSAAKDLVH